MHRNTLLAAVLIVVPFVVGFGFVDPAQSRDRQFLTNAFATARDACDSYGTPDFQAKREAFRACMAHPTAEKLRGTNAAALEALCSAVESYEIASRVNDVSSVKANCERNGRKFLEMAAMMRK